MSNNAPIACHEFATEMWLLVSGEMPEDQQQFWQRHLQDCPRCQEVLAAAQAVQTQYASLPLYEAPEGLVRRLAHEAKLQKEEVGWLENISRWFPTIAWRYDFKPRRVIAGVALAALVLMFFHQLAFRPKIQHTWEARTFDQKVSELWSTLETFNQEVSELDQQLADLNYRIAAMAVELENTD
jgi:anti-sigma factor RsiW